MKSPRGLAAAVTFLLAAPIAALYQAVFAHGVEVVIHALLAAGASLTASAVGDFKTPAWTRWLGWASSGVLAVIFFLQGIAEAAHHDGLTRFAYGVLGQGVEGWLVYLFLVWCLAVLAFDSRGWIKMLGFVAVALAASASVLDQKVLGLLPFVWLLLESYSKRSASIGSSPAAFRAG